MSSIYHMKPHPKRVIWAGATLGHALGMPADTNQHEVGEVLDASALSEMPSHVSGGVDDGLSLHELFERDADTLLGALRRPEQRFPMLVKRLDTSSALSVQVHPNDAMAEHLAGEPNGKSEAWVILDAAEDAHIFLGFREGVSKADVERGLADGSVTELMRKIPVRAGDVIPVPAGCAHTIGAGIYLFEVQQTSDLTYRLYDWDRVDHDGQPRTLHVSEGLAAVDLDLRPEKARPVTLQKDAGGSRVLLVDMDVFTIEEWAVEASFEVGGGSLLIVQGLEGEASFVGEGGAEIRCGPGQTLLISAANASLTVASESGARVLVARHLRC